MTRRLETGDVQIFFLKDEIFSSPCRLHPSLAERLAAGKLVDNSPGSSGSSRHNNSRGGEYFLFCIFY